jgi:hypothetical protein
MGDMGLREKKNRRGRGPAAVRREGALRYSAAAAFSRWASFSLMRADLPERSRR